MRDRIVTVRLTQAEYEQLQRRAEKGGRSVSQQIREELLQRDWQLPPMPSAGSMTIPATAVSSVIWLTDGHQDGATITVAA